MKKLLDPKIRILLLSGAGLAALALLSAALRNLKFRPPEPFSFNIGQLPVLTPSIISSGTEIPLWRYLLFGILLLIIVSIIVFLMDAEMRKRFLRRMFRFTMSMVAIWLVLTYAYERGTLKQLLPPTATEGGPAAAEAAAAVPPPVYVPPQINPWLVFAISFVIGLGLVLLAWFIYMRRQNNTAHLGLVKVADIARDALDDLQDGHNWDDAIVRAYIRMNEVVIAERGLLRQPSSTPREFAQHMERMGLPGGAVRSLTSLFEGVRYGGKSSSQAERDLAAAALSAILHSCGRSA